MDYLTNKEFELIDNNEEDQKKFENLLNETIRSVNSYTIDGYSCDYEDKTGSVIMRINFDPADRDLFKFEFIESGETFNVKNLNLEII